MDEYLPLREVVFEALRDAIVHGEFEPGERLLEVALAKRLGVSRTPVREAIRMLELEGLVVMVPRKGAEVARITEKDLRDALEIRLSLEELAVELACKRIDEDGRLRLREACENFREAVRSGRVPDIVDTDVAFHETICELSNNPRTSESRCTDTVWNMCGIPDIMASCFVSMTRSRRRYCMEM